MPIPDAQMKFTSPAQTLRSQHLDYVHDIAFDHYGRRIATCSGDRTVKVWDLNDDGEWTLSPGSEWQAHRGSVWRLSWAHPEFGQLLATCASDHAAKIWEEREGGFSLSQPGGGGGSNPSGAADLQPPAAQQQQQGQPTTRWVAKAQLTDARRAVSCIQFAPRHLGLKLATGSADGLVRIYEAIDVQNLNHWPMNGSIEAEVADSDSAPGAQGGPSSSIVTSSSSSASPSSQDPGEPLGVTALSWCTGRFEPPTLVVGGSSGRVSVYRYSDASRLWHLAVRLPGHGRGVLDVSWSPNVGRSYHLVASTGKDDVLRVHRLKRRRGEQVGAAPSGADGSGAATTPSIEFESSQVLDTAGAQVWRCQWNVTGTVLASSGDGGIVQLWKSDFENLTWKCVSEIHGDVQ